jgi:predicted nicotinamide N-methyase
MGLSPDQIRVYGNPLAAVSPPLCPEIRLWLLDGAVDLNAQIEPIFRGETIPFWAFCWGSGQALARYILDNPEEVRGKRVVDYGAGSAVAAIAATMAGAAAATAVDIDEQARRMALYNARLNRVTLEVSESVPARWDVLLAADVLYEERATDWMADAIRRGERVILCSPEREGTPRIESRLGRGSGHGIRCQPPLRVSARTFPDVDTPVRESVIYSFVPSPAETAP